MTGSQEGRSLAALASIKGHTEIVKLLIKYDADVNMKDNVRVSIAD